MNNNEQQLFLQFYESLAPEARETLLGEMNMLERKYNLEVTHGGNKNNQR